MAMTSPIGKTTSLMAETWDFFLAARIAVTEDWQNIHFETDSTTLLNLIVREHSEAPWIIQTMLQEIRDHLQQLRRYVVTHTYMEANQAADGLADFAAKKQLQNGNGSTNSISTNIWEHTCPDFLNVIVMNDSMGTPYPIEVLV
ncbi:uncharacterized protein LOC113294589 [Papaver somniferum]|uniref:uncharacterized protein LOC113294589 n=1 Tax=Papaver somniferum TaxID=3469 RepID=UPI000E6FA4BB|nr:uncharacterized protein LOC113294589 [Papaver somniferum]